MAQTPMRGATFLPIVVDDNLIVTDKLDAQTTLEIGDRLIKVNDVVLTDSRQFQHVVRNSRANITLRLRVVRQNVLHELEVVPHVRPINQLSLPVRDQTGTLIKPDDWTGTTVVYVWSVNCRICTAIAPDIARLARENSAVRFVALSPDPTNLQLLAPTAKTLNGWPLLVDGLLQLNSLMIFEYPSFVVLDGTTIRATFRGRSDLAKLKRLLSATRPDALEGK